MSIAESCVVLVAVVVVVEAKDRKEWSRRQYLFFGTIIRYDIDDDVDIVGGGYCVGVEDSGCGRDHRRLLHYFLHLPSHASSLSSL